MNYLLYREVGRIREMVVVAVQKIPGRGAAVTLLWSSRSDLVIIIMSSQRAKGKQVVETVNDDNQLSAEESGGSEPERATNESIAQTPSKKNKKKKSKVSRLLNPVAGVEEEIVETVFHKVKAEHTGVDESSIRATIRQLKLKDVIVGKSGLGGKNQKETGGHRVRDYHAFYVRYSDGSPTVLGHPTSPTIWYCHTS
jgi:hypothetical protein